MEAWNKAQAWEAEWHGNCINSLNEELKQIVYAEKMGLIRTPIPKTPYNFDLNGKTILDIGGGAYSLLLKCTNYEDGTTVTDPLMSKYPKWVIDRYNEANIMPLNVAGEDLVGIEGMLHIYWDEVWIYNVLEHTKDPKTVLENALQLGNIVRIFEWLETSLNIGHIHSLKRELLDEWLGGEGKVEMVNRDGAVGKAYYGVFKGDNYVASSD